MKKEDIIKMLIHFAKYNPDILYKYSKDNDKGKKIFTEFVEDYIINNNLFYSIKPKEDE